MRALITTGDADRPVALDDVSEPDPAPTDVLVRVEATSLNRGECRRAAGSAPGEVLGWDVVGIVEQAPDGTAPPGSRVVGLTSTGAWAERVALPAGRVAVVPDDVAAIAAATLPVAAMTAYHALARGGLALGTRVAVTGATGGVGRFALQLARLGGAHATAVVSAPDRTDGLVEVDAIEVGLDGGDAAFDLVLESVGGPLLAAAIRRLRPGGAVVTYGSSSGQPTTLDARALYRANRSSVSGLLLFDELDRVGGATATLDRLLALVATGLLDTGAATVSDWRDAPVLVRRLLDREIAGKAVLTIA